LPKLPDVVQEIGDQRLHVAERIRLFFAATVARISVGWKRTTLRDARVKPRL
jgi:hypothetical protein